MSKEKHKILMVVDGNSLIHRGFHAIPHLSTSKGFPSNGVYGFATIFLNAVRKFQPDYVAVCFDLEGPTFRDELYKEYKAKRVKAPDELYQQIPKVKEFVRSLNLPVFEKQRFEADDLIGTIVRHKDGQLKKIIVTGDLDALQLVSEDTSVLTTKKGLSEIVDYDERAVIGRYGFGPEHIIDFKALRGDASDNIPGVKGIGEKGAIDLIKRFGSVENLYRELESNTKKAQELSPKLSQKLKDHKADCLLSKKLATIDIDVPIKFEIEKTRFGTYKAEDALGFLREMEFKSLLDKLPKPFIPDSEEAKIQTQEAKPKEIFISDSYRLIRKQSELDKLVEQISQQDQISVDTETTAEKEMEAELLGVSICFKKGEAFYVPYPHKSNKTSLDWSGLVTVLGDKNIKKTGHNLKYDYLVLRIHGISLNPVSYDTMIAAYLLNPGARGYGLDDLAFTRFGHQMVPIESLIGKKGKDQKSLADIDLEQVAQYSCEDADYAFRLKYELDKDVKKEKLDKVLAEIDVPLVPVLAEIENNGVLLDSKKLNKLAERVTDDLSGLEQKIYKHSKQKFNINSPQQMKEVLFNKLQISTLDIKKTKTGLSTAASELEKMKDLHPIVPLILEYRELAKLKNTYLDALPELVNKKTGRVHTSFNQTIAATGRLSSTDPNLQNIPIRTELGNKIREGFVPTRGYKLLSCDYSQIELRVVAHIAQDKTMMKIFKEGKDIHTATAAEVFGIPESKVGPDERRYAKVINFGVLYGLSAYGFSQQIPGVSIDKAQAFIDQYFSAYKGVDSYVKQIIQECKKHGYIANPLGRKRYLPEINSSQFNVRSAAERAAINTPVQSLAADIIKVAMINIAKEIRVDNPECRMVLQVHDELLFEVRTDKVKHYADKIKELMEGAIELSVPIVVEAKSGDSWGEMSKLQ